jgi:hypothetical protein
MIRPSTVRPDRRLCPWPLAACCGPNLRRTPLRAAPPPALPWPPVGTQQRCRTRPVAAQKFLRGKALLLLAAPSANNVFADKHTRPFPGSVYYR